MSNREFNPRSFFRWLNHDIRDRLLGQFDLLDKIEAHKRADDPEQDQVYFAWSRTPDSCRTVSDRELRRINDLSSENARFYLNLKATEIWRSKPALLKQAHDLTNQDLAATLYLESKAAFDEVYNDVTLDDYNYRVKRQGKRPQLVELSPEKKVRLRTGLVEFFRQNRDGDRQIQIEDHLDDTRFGLFIYHEDRPRYEDGFDARGQIISQKRRPVAQAMAAYYPKNGLLMVKARAPRLQTCLIALIGEIYFADPDFFETLHANEFDLTPLNNPSFDMPYNAGEGIGGVRVVEISLASLDSDVGRSTIACPNGHVAALKSLGLQLDAVSFDGVKIRIEPDYRNHRRPRTISIEKPDRWNLKDTPRDRQLAAYVDAWGFMKKEQADAGQRMEDYVVDANRLGESLRARVAARYQGPNPGMAY